MLQRQKRLKFLPVMHSAVSTKCNNSHLFQYFSEFYLLLIQLKKFWAFFVAICPSFFNIVTSKSRHNHKSFHKSSGAIILFAAYSVYGQIFVHFPSKFSPLFNSVSTKSFH